MGMETPDAIRTTEARELMQLLAAKEIECPEDACSGILSSEFPSVRVIMNDCNTCKGSGKIPKFPTLQRECCTARYPCWRYDGKQCQGWKVPPEASWRSLIEDIALGMELTVLLSLTHAVVATIDHSHIGADSDTTTNLLRAFCLALEKEGR